MVKNLKLNIKNDQLASALQIKPLKGKKKPQEEAEPEKEAKKPSAKAKAQPHTKESAAAAAKEEAAKKPRARIMAAPEETPTPIAQQEIKETKKDWEEQVPKHPSVEVEVKGEPEPAPKIDGPVAEHKSPVTAQTSKEEPVKPKPTESKEEDKSQLIKHKKIEPVAAAEEEPRKLQGFRDFKPPKKREDRFDTRDRQGLRVQDEEIWRKKRKFGKKLIQEEVVIRPKSLKIRLPITLKDLAQEMKLKASQLISKLFMQGVTLTLNDYLDDETTIQLLGHDFDCEITIDTSEEDRLRITGKSITEEITATPADLLEYRAPVIAFMGHVDHGKTSLIDAIRKSNIAAGEAGAITQHIGAFKTKTTSGEITILDTPGHEAFFEMRERGANVTDIVILVVAGDEGMREQTMEALKQAKEAKVPIIVAINKADKQAFDPQKVYRELADNELLPEAWGGSTITVNCSAITRQGIPELLEMVHLQAEILELKANAQTRARGTVLESEMHKGLGAVATVLVQNGTLKMGDAVVLGHTWGRIKTMHDEYGHPLSNAGPSTPVKITGLSGLAEAGSDFIIVKTEKEARDLAQDRAEGHKQKLLQLSKKAGTEKLLQLKKESGEKKVLPLIIKADVQGSLEALKNSLMKLPADKVRIEIVNESVGEVSESDIELAAASKSTILGFHTKMESHAESLVKLKKVTVRMHDIIYHAVDDVRALMTELLDKIEQQKDTGTAVVKALFKSSQYGIIAGCIVTDGTIVRNNFMRVIRDKEVVWSGKIASLKRIKEDVKEVNKGFECGIVLEGYQDIKVDDTLQAYEIIYLKQQL